MLALIVTIIFALFQYVVAEDMIGLSHALAAIVAAQTGFVAGLLAWLGGPPTAGSGLGRRLT
jgi:hypothetical protein